MTRYISRHRPDRAPASTPRPFPAHETSWHGKPPITQSTGSKACGSSVVTSSWHGTSGQCLASTARQNGSSSHWPTMIMPARSAPRSKPPMPLKSDSTLMLHPASPGSLKMREPLRPLLWSAAGDTPRWGFGRRGDLGNAWSVLEHGALTGSRPAHGALFSFWLGCRSTRRAHLPVGALAFRAKVITTQPPQAHRHPTDRVDDQQEKCAATLILAASPAPVNFPPSDF